MNKGNRVLSALLIGASIGLLFALLSIDSGISDYQLLNLPSYYQPTSLTNVYYLGGCAAVFGIFGSLFAWIRTKLDSQDSRYKETVITEDVNKAMTTDMVDNSAEEAEKLVPGSEDATQLLSDKAEATELLSGQEDDTVLVSADEDKTEALIEEKEGDR